MFISASAVVLVAAFLIIYTSLLFSEDKKKSIFFIKNKLYLDISLIAVQFIILLLLLFTVNKVSKTILCYTLIFSSAITIFYILFGEKLISLTSDKNRFIKRLFLSILVILLCEIFVFNFASFNFLFSKNKIINLDLSKAQLTGFTLSQDSTSIQSEAGKSCSLEFNNLQTEIETIYIDISSDSASEKINIQHDEETSKALRSDTSIETIKNNEYSKYALCSYSGKVNTLKINITPEKNDTVCIRSITVNEDIPFNFSFIRFAVFFLLFNLISAFSLLSAFKKPVSNGLFFKKSIAVVILIFLITGCSFTCFISKGLIKDFTDPPKNQINAELVDAFEAGQVNLKREVEPDLQKLDNPYDWSERDKAGVSYAWDHCLYNGQYFSYYGIAPVLLLFLPYHLITGMYFPSLWAIFLFCSAGILFLGMTYYTFIKRFFPDISRSIGITGLIITEIISGIWFCLPLANFYEIAQSSGFAFVTAGAYFLLSSGAVGSDKISLPRAALSSVFLALGVLCRPTLTVYCLAALLFIFFGAKKLYSMSKVKVSVFKYLLSALLPFVIIGSIQMVYNYLRFDSVFDFGIQYSLTINDFTKTHYHLPLAIIGFYNFIFALPRPTVNFPFIESNYSTLGVNGYYFTANKYAIGILFRALPVFSYLFSSSAYKKAKNKKAAILIFVNCILCPFIIIFSIWESGYGVRYCVDFSWQILFGALAIAFLIYSKASHQIKKIIESFFSVSLVLCILVNGAQLYSFLLSIADSACNYNFLSFGRLFEFWNLM